MSTGGDDGGQAFAGEKPVELPEGFSGNYFGPATAYYSGMTYRQWLDGLALQALVSTYGMAPPKESAYVEHEKDIARMAAKYADAMLQERKK